MLAALIIVFREVFEAGLIVGVVLAVTRGVRHRTFFIALGVLAGVLGAGILALSAGALSAAFAGAGEEVFSAIILVVAVMMLTWHNAVMARHGRELAAAMQTAGQAVVSGSKSLIGLAIVVCLAVLREGFEVVLFLYGVVVSTEPGAGLSIVLGSVIGLLLGASVCALTYLGLLTIPARYLFKVTSTLITFLSAGMAAQATVFLEQANIVTALPQTLWDSSAVLSQASLIGRALHTLIGYSDRPTVIELAVYLGMLGLGFMLMRVLAPARAPIRVAPT